jgi:glycosyltransferase involved in cell wall biosynthesis
VTRVALLHAWYWPEVQRGSERVIHDLAVDLVALGHRPRVVTSHRGLPRRTVEDGVEVLRQWRPPDLPLRVRKFQDALTHLPLSYAALRAGDDEVAHAFFASDALPAVAWARRTGRPAVFSYMGIPQREVLTSARRRLQILEHVTTRADAVVALSRAARDAMWRWLGVEARVVYPGVDLDAFTPGGERAPEPTIACASDPADARKRLDLLVRAFGHVRRERPTARLLLVEPRDPAMRARLAEPGVEFFDMRPDGVVRVFREAWVSGLASFNEAFGLVLVESLACGTPVFGMRDGGVPEIVDRPEVGRLFDGDDERDVARAVLEALELAEDPGTAAACRARAEAFGTMAGARAYAALYRELLGARSA